MKEIKVRHEGTLLEYLINDLHYSRNVAKKILNNKVVVNGVATSKFDYKLNVGDVMIIGDNTKKTDLDIIYEDDDFVCINKPAGLLSISNDKERERTAYHLVREYVKSIDKHNMIFILHRLDKDTSGVLLFCKKQKLRDELQENWNDIVYKRGYYALCEGVFDEPIGHIENHIAYNKFNMGYVSEKGSLCITDYKVIKQNKDSALVDVDIKTGRKNQIRITFKDIDHPIVGDKNYGGRKAKRLYLHAYELAFRYKNKDYVFKSDMPSLFRQKEL